MAARSEYFRSCHLPVLSVACVAGGIRERASELPRELPRGLSRAAKPRVKFPFTASLPKQKHARANSHQLRRLVLSAEQNDRQSEEINVTDEPQAENRPVPVQEAEIRWTKNFLGRPLCLFCLAAAQKITHAAHLLFLLGELYVKAGYICFNPSGWVAQLSGAPSLHVNRPLGFCPFILKLLQCLCKSPRKRNPNKSKISREHFYRG